MCDCILLTNYSKCKFHSLFWSGLHTCSLDFFLFNSQNVLPHAHNFSEDFSSNYTCEYKNGRNKVNGKRSNVCFFSLQRKLRALIKSILNNGKDHSSFRNQPKLDFDNSLVVFPLSWHMVHHHFFCVQIIFLSSFNFFFLTFDSSNCNCPQDEKILHIKTTGQPRAISTKIVADCGGILTKP